MNEVRQVLYKDLDETVDFLLELLVPGHNLLKYFLKYRKTKRHFEPRHYISEF